MPTKYSDSHFLDVPYFQQTKAATCGPACLMMIMKYWDPSFELSRKCEFQLWKKSYSLFFLGGTFQFGLAATAVQHGFKAEMYQKTPFSDCYPRFPQLANIIETILSLKSQRLDVPIRYGFENLGIIRDALSQSIPPIVFINLFPILGENVFHWVVITGLNEDTVYMNDPYVPRDFSLREKKNHPVPLDIFSKSMRTDKGRSLRFPPCVVLVKK
ncbi:MAG: hypothetical protein BV459_05605 [Thermoplasmata archaeon M11B2D]|nr:MAG: hypothetical protein BV459_05605 [Thermoplasmata archaeon M11B2D]